MISICNGHVGGFTRMTFSVIHSGNGRKSKRVSSIGIQATTRIACSMAAAHGYSTITVMGKVHPATPEAIESALKSHSGEYSRKS